ncbi:hypothetical protein KL86APRO_10455 [uncultured Alphaproteobacteria bacterium]|uniref:Uncharacterized protein n=1 Tax=uncultured Alphaproteobacteria bacterium TaxID=91750 RepID=A0A212J3H2_9PROT|nr:hypothetical protein KL86APRO_10455 [uncultured Alphaproteobacteria bacterium]
MARIRTIKPEFFRHADLFDAEEETGLPLRLAFAGLWTACDREGRFEWKPRQLKLDCLPYDDVDFSRVLDALATRGFVRKYEADGNAYGWVPSFTRHQIINNREKDSALPLPPQGFENSGGSTPAPRDGDACPTPHGNASVEGEGEREKEGKEEGVKVIDAGAPSDRPEAAPPAHPAAKRDEIAEMVAIWNETAIDLALPRVQKLTGPRLRKAHARLKDCGGLDGWRSAMAKLRNCPWMLGDNDRSWRADFDFIVSETKFARLMEGSYDRAAAPRAAAAARGFGDAVSHLRARIAEAAHA